MTRPGTEPWSHGPLANTLPTWTQLKDFVSRKEEKKLIDDCIDKRNQDLKEYPPTKKKIVYNTQ